MNALVNKTLDIMTDEIIEFLEERYTFIYNLEPLEKQTLEESIYILLLKWIPKFKEIINTIIGEKKMKMDLSNLKETKFDCLCKNKLFDNGEYLICPTCRKIFDRLTGKVIYSKF